MNWPISHEDEMKEKRKAEHGLFSSFRKKISLIAASTLLFLSSGDYLKNNPEISNINPDLPAQFTENTFFYPQINPDQPAESKTSVDKYTLEYEEREREKAKIAKKQILIKKSVSEKTSYYTPEQYEERIKLARKIAAQYGIEVKQPQEEKISAKSHSIPKIEIVEQQTILPQRKIGKNWKDTITSYWERKSEQRSLDKIVAKIVTYYPDGHKIVSYPQITKTYVVSSTN
jgi:hypothetical protein